MKEFHKPFLQSLIVVAIVTAFSMILSHKLVDYYYHQHLKTPYFTSQKFQESSFSPVQQQPAYSLE